jgi:molecular chaperone DnaK
MEGEDAEAIKKATDELAQSAHKLAEAMYAKEQPAEHAETGAAGEQPKKDTKKDETVVDADFEEVKSDKK